MQLIITHKDKKLPNFLSRQVNLIENGQAKHPLPIVNDLDGEAERRSVQWYQEKPGITNQDLFNNSPISIDNALNPEKRAQLTPSEVLAVYLEALKEKRYDVFPGIIVDTPGVYSTKEKYIEITWMVPYCDRFLNPNTLSIGLPDNNEWRHRLWRVGDSRRLKRTFIPYAYHSHITFSRWYPNTKD